MNTNQPASKWNSSLPLDRCQAAGFCAASENLLAATALLAMMLLPALELLSRHIFKTGIVGASDYVQNLTLWVGFLGAILAARAKQHLTFVPKLTFLPRRCQTPVAVFATTISALVALWLCWAAWQFVQRNATTLARLEDELLAASLRTWRQRARTQPLGLAPVLAAFLALRAEARDFRRLTWGVSLGAPPGLVDDLVSAA